MAVTLTAVQRRILAVDIEGEELIVALSLMGAETEIRLGFEHVHKAA